MRWVSALVCAVCLSACGGEVYRGVFVPDGGVDVPIPGEDDVVVDPIDDPTPGPADDILTTYRLLASSYSDFGGVQGENGWHYGFIRPELYVVAGRGNTGPTTGPQAGASAADLYLDGLFTEFPHFDDVVPFQDGPEWVRFEDMRWLYVGAEGLHPHGPVGALGVAKQELWATRRYAPNQSGLYRFRARAELRPEVLPCPQNDGVVVEVWKDLRVVDLARLTITEDGTAVEARFDRELFLGESSVVDFVVKPRGNDICDNVELDVDVLEQITLR